MNGQINPCQLKHCDALFDDPPFRVIIANSVTRDFCSRNHAILFLSDPMKHDEGADYIEQTEITT